MCIEEKIEYKPSSTEVLETIDLKKGEVYHHSQPNVPCYAKGPVDSTDKDQAMKLGSVLSQANSHNEKMLAAALDKDNVLDYSPFNFYQGINQRRLLKGRS